TRHRCLGPQKFATVSVLLMLRLLSQVISIFMQFSKYFVCESVKSSGALLDKGACVGHCQEGTRRTLLALSIESLQQNLHLGFAAFCVALQLTCFGNVVVNVVFLRSAIR